MKEYLNNKKEDGVVLVTSMLFLMIVTILAVSSLQSPKTDIMISGNKTFINQAQQVANIGIMAAKNWMEVHKGQSGVIPYNIVVNNIVKIQAGAIDPNKDLGGGVKASDLGTFTGSTPVSVFRPISGVGVYRWNLIRLTGSTPVIGSETDVDDKIDEYKRRGTKKVIKKNMLEDLGIGEGISGDNMDGPEKGYYSYYVFSEGRAGNDSSILAYSEAIIKYKFIRPNVGYE